MTTPHTPAGPFVSPRVAAEMNDITRPELDDLIRRGAVRTERIKGSLFIDLEDATRAVRAAREGGASDATR